MESGRRRFDAGIQGFGRSPNNSRSRKPPDPPESNALAENRVLRAYLPARLRLSDPERCTLAEIGKRLGRKALQKVACVAKPDSILTWYRRLIAHKFDGSQYRTYPGRPRISAEVQALVVRFARENSGWGY